MNLIESAKLVGITCQIEESQVVWDAGGWWGGSRNYSWIVYYPRHNVHGSEDTEEECLAAINRVIEDCFYDRVSHCPGQSFSAWRQYGKPLGLSLAEVFMLRHPVKKKAEQQLKLF